MNKDSKRRHPKPDKRDMQAFAVLAKSFTDEFKPVAEALLLVIRENAIRQVESPPSTKEEFSHFVDLVHEGWKKAQRVIAGEVLAKLAAQDQSRASESEHKRLGNLDEQKRLGFDMYRRKTEITVLRRMLDAIAWNALHREHSTIRRLSLNDGRHNFSAHNIVDAMPEVDRLNADPKKMAICTDLTTFIHLGDILLLDMGSGQIQFIELKSGERNMHFVRAAYEENPGKQVELEKEIRLSGNAKDIRHFERVRRQYERGVAIASTLNKEEGFDPRTGGHVQITPVLRPMERYSDYLVECWKQLSADKSWSIATVDDCLHIGVYNKPDHALVGFSAWMDAIGCKSPKYNITDSFRLPGVLPFASLDLPTSLLVDVIKGEVQIIICLDIREFINMTNAAFPNFLSVGSKRETAMADSRPITLLKYEGKVIRYNGGGLIGQGIVDRIIFDLQSPKNLMQMHWDIENGDATSIQATDSVSGEPAPQSPGVSAL